MKQYKLFYFFLLFSNFIFAQNWPWATSGYGDGVDHSYGICKDQNNNIITTGAFSSSVLVMGTTSLTSLGFDMYLSKYDLNGNLLWAKSSGGNSTDFAHDVATDAAGNIFVVGEFQSPVMTFGTYTISNAGYADGFLAKYDQNGNVLWVKSMGGTQFETINSVAVDALGNILLTGNFESNSLTLGSYTLNHVGNGDVFVAKYDNNGNVIWAKSAGGYNWDRSEAICIDPVGNTIITGIFQSATLTAGSFTLNNPQPPGITSQFFIVKYDINGNELWAKTTNQAKNEGRDICSDQFGNIYAAGYFYSPTITFSTINLTNAGSFNAFLVKYDANGNVIWAKKSNSPYSLSCFLAIDSSNIYISGGGQFPITFGPYLIQLPSGSGSDPMYIVKYDLNGNELCVGAVNGGGDATGGASMVTDQQGNVFMAGSYSENPFVLGTNTLIPQGQRNVFVAKYNCAATTDIKKYTAYSSHNLYPNPNSGSFIVTLDNINEGKFVLINSIGEWVFTQHIKSGANEIKIDQIPIGLYSYLIFNEEQQLSTGKISIK